VEHRTFLIKIHSFEAEQHLPERKAPVQNLFDCPDRKHRTRNAAPTKKAAGQVAVQPAGSESIASPTTDSGGRPSGPPPGWSCAYLPARQVACRIQKGQHVTHVVALSDCVASRRRRRRFRRARRMECYCPQGHPVMAATAESALLVARGELGPGRLTAAQ
jgi:hypothetical protein